MIKLIELQNELQALNVQLVDLNNKLEDIETNPQEYTDLESQHDDLLDELYNEVCEALPVCMTGSELIRDFDPTLYRCSYSEFCSDYDYSSLDIYVETQDEITDIEDQISDLENEIEDLENEEDQQ